MKLVMWSFLLFSFSSIAGQTFYDSSGFPVCYQNKDQIYFFDWDHISNAQQKSVMYFEKSDYISQTGHSIKDCTDYKYINNVPSEILKSFINVKSIFPEQILNSVDQIRNGARLFRSEKTTQDFIINHPELFQLNSPNQIDQFRTYYGDKFALDLIQTWTQKIIPDQQSCEKYIGNCDFYLCQEQKNSCGLQGYNLGFGFKYCSDSRFKLLSEMATLQGKNWVQSVFQCLQKESLKTSNSMTRPTCEQIKDQAYDSHPNCYAQAGFCDLKMSEKLKIFQLIKNEILSTASIKQGMALLEQCGGMK
jgi:hypothetical protein